LSGAKLAPVIAPAGRRAETRQRRGDMAIGGVGNAAFDIGHRRERRVHQHDAGRDGGIEMIVDLGRVEARDGNGREEKRQQMARVSASSLRTSAPPAISARMASRPVPADGSSTRSAGVMAAAWAATRPSGIGVENCWKVWLSSERRVCVGSRLAIFDSAESRAAGDPALRKSAFRICGGTGRSPPRRRHRPSSSPRRRWRRGAEGGLHRRAQGGGVDALAAFEMGQQQAGGREDGGGGFGIGAERKRRGGGRRRRMRKSWSW
jgi:hypothetical protein